jgi:hypothetical protein
MDTRARSNSIIFTKHVYKKCVCIIILFGHYSSSIASTVLLVGSTCVLV